MPPFPSFALSPQLLNLTVFATRQSSFERMLMQDNIIDVCHANTPSILFLRRRQSLSLLNAFLSAAQRLEKASAQALSASTEVDDMRKAETDQVRSLVMCAPTHQDLAYLAHPASLPPTSLCRSHSISRDAAAEARASRCKALAAARLEPIRASQPEDGRRQR